MERVEIKVNKIKLALEDSKALGHLKICHKLAASIIPET